jgi:hypothetical protein
MSGGSRLQHKTGAYPLVVPDHAGEPPSIDASQPSLWIALPPLGCQWVLDRHTDASEAGLAFRSDGAFYG